MTLKVIDDQYGQLF